MVFAISKMFQRFHVYISLYISNISNDVVYPVVNHPINHGFWGHFTLSQIEVYPIVDLYRGFFLHWVYNITWNIMEVCSEDQQNILIYIYIYVLIGLVEGGNLQDTHIKLMGKTNQFPVHHIPSTNPSILPSNPIKPREIH